MLKILYMVIQNRSSFDVVKDGIREYWNRRAKEYDMAPGHGGEEEFWKDLGHVVVGIDFSENSKRESEKEWFEGEFLTSYVDDLPFNDNEIS